MAQLWEAKTENRVSAVLGFLFEWTWQGYTLG
jgi:hypothetical protein